MNNILNKSLKDQDWLGVVINNKDKTFAGRCQVRVFRLLDDIADDDLPWASPISSGVFAGDGAGNISIPKVGQIVRIQFNDGDMYAPEYTAIQNIDTALIEQIKDDYEGTHVIAFDPEEGLNIIHQRNLGIQIFYRDSFIQISPDSMITIQHANQDSIIQLEGDKCNITTKNEINITAGARVEVVADEVKVAGNQTTKIGPGPYYSGVLAEPLFALLKTLASSIDAKMPATPGVNVTLVKQGEKLATSRNVKSST